MKLGVISLGCDKATVDSECLVADLVRHGAVVTRALDDAEVILVSTCGFIDAAKRESVEAILQAARMKEEGRCRAVVAVGCLVARHGEELKREIPEADYFFGFRDLPRLVPQLGADLVLDDPVALHPGVRRYFGTAPHVRYLKISEGCDHTCACCAIPLMRGRHRSRPVEELVAEARELEAQGAREINLVAQDLVHYGRDLGDGGRRPERQRTIRAKVQWLRAAVPDIAIRTTVLVGFPGETHDDVRELLGFMEETQFDRLGAAGRLVRARVVDALDYDVIAEPAA